jgi:hypothetical protein
MNLSDYLDQEITVRLRNGDVCTSIVGNIVLIYPIIFSDTTYTNEGRAYTYSECGYDIVEVISSNSNSSNNTNTMNQTPQTVQDFIDLFTAVKNEYGNIVVRHASDKYEATSEDCRNEFQDILVVGGCKSLISDNKDAVEEPALVFVI